MAQLTPPAEPNQATNVRWLVFALACSTSWLFTLHRYTFGLIKPDLMISLIVTARCSAADK